MKRTVWLVLLIFIVAGRALAQNNCPTIVQTALEIATDACSDLGRNQACYGNVTLQAEPLEGADFTFEQTGDIVNLGDVASLHLSAMDTGTDSWGIALLRTQANLPDTLPGQNVAMVLFGEVDMTDAAPRSADAPAEEAPIFFQLTATKTVTVRSEPSRGGEVVESLSSGSTMTADGQNEDGKWLHIQLEDGRTGWVLANLVSVDGDVSQLPVTDGAVEAVADGDVSYTPMQAFYFSSGIGDSGCAQAPDSGILIQTPEGTRTITLRVNEVDITLGSTAYVQAGSGEMTLNVVEGEGTASAFDKKVAVPAGSRTRIPLDTNGVASGPPADPEPYVAASLNALPTTLLPQSVGVAAPLTQDEIIAKQPLYVGTWAVSASADCSLIKGVVSFNIGYVQAFGEEPVWDVMSDVSTVDDYYIPYLITNDSTPFLNDLQKDGRITIPGHFEMPRQDGPPIEVDIHSPTSITVKNSVIITGGFCVVTLEFTAEGSTPETVIINEEPLYVGTWTMTATFNCGILGSGTATIPWEHDPNAAGIWNTSLTELQNSLGVLFPLPQGFVGAIAEKESNHTLTIPGDFSASGGGITMDISVFSSTSITGTLNYPEVECVMDVTLEAND